MNEQHPVYELFQKARKFNNEIRVTATARGGASFDMDKSLHRELAINSAIQLVENTPGAVTSEKLEGGDIRYRMSACFLTEEELFKLLDKAFIMGTEFQYENMRRILGERLALEEQEKEKDNVKKSTE